MSGKESESYLCTPRGSAPTGDSKSISLWLDCDTGHDDAFAILMAAMHPALNLLGISTIHGNASLENTTYNTCAVLKAIGCNDIPVYAGTAKPFCRASAPAAAIHGQSGLDGTSLPTPKVPARTDRSAIEAMYTALKSCSPQSVWLVATGPLTNAAILFLLHPDLVSHIGGLSIMGGSIGGGFTEAKVATKTHGSGSFGNKTAFAEFNIFCDPEAAHSIFSNPALAAKTTLIPLDLTHLVRATTTICDKVLGKSTIVTHAAEHVTTTQSTPPKASPFPVRRLFHEILIFFAQTYADVFGLTDGPPLHDPLAVAAVFAPTLFDDRGGERWTVDVVRDDVVRDLGDGKKEASQCGRTVVRKVEGDGGGVRIPRGLDVEVFWDMVDLCLGRAEGR